MELRHLRYFLVLAEELHFTRAAERLHIEQSPLSRIIKNLENEFGALLFYRNKHGTRLTTAGEVLVADMRRLFDTLEQAKENVRAVASGLRGVLRIAISDGAVEPRLSVLLARSREEEPDLEVRLSEVPLAKQLQGLRQGNYDLGFARSNETASDILAKPAWHDPLFVAVPSRHPLVAFSRIPLEKLAHHSLILCDPQACEGYSRQLARILRTLDGDPIIAEHVVSIDMMLTLVAAGYGIGFATAALMEVCRHPEVVMRPIDGEDASITTYLLRLESNVSDPVRRFTTRLEIQMQSSMRDTNISP